MTDREEFEAFARSRGLSTTLTVSRADYMYVKTRWAWAGFQAARATAEQSGDSVDAKRYRWLRDVSEPGICAFFLSVGKAFDGVKFKRETVDEAIDAQIDAAIESQRSGDGS